MNTETQTKTCAMNNDQLTKLEDIIDKYGIVLVAISIGNILEAKSDYVATNWQDPLLAGRYADLAAGFYALIERL